MGRSWHLIMYDSSSLHDKDTRLGGINMSSQDTDTAVSWLSLADRCVGAKVMHSTCRAGVIYMITYSLLLSRLLDSGEEEGSQ